MQPRTQLENKIMIKLFTDFSTKYNASNIAKVLNKTRVGTFKALKKLEKERLVIGETLGRARFYKLNLEDDYVKKSIELLLMEKARKNQRWINEFEPFFEYAQIVMIFGSIIKNEKAANDIDLLIVLDKKDNKEINKIISSKNLVLTKKIHAIKQTEEDMIKNLKSSGKVMQNVIKNGIVLKGYEKLVSIIQDVTNPK